MLDADVAERARHRLALDIEDRTRALAKAILEIRSRMNAAGVLPSSMTLTQIAEACAKDARERGTLAWNALRQSLETAGELRPDTTVEDLGEFFSRHVDFQDLRIPVVEAQLLIQNERMAAEAMAEMDRSQEFAAKRFRSEAEHFVSLRRTSPNVAPGQEVNVAIPVARLQTEPGEEEWRSVRTFFARTLELSTSSLVVKGYDLSATFSWNAGEPPRWIVKAVPAEEPFRSLLLTFRHFWANDEPGNFLRVLNIVAKHAPDARPLTDQLRKRWNDALFGGVMFMSFNGNPLTADRVFDLWINAHYFHNDETKKQDLDRLAASLSPDFVKFLLANAVTECCKAILALDYALSRLK